MIIRLDTNVVVDALNARAGGRRFLQAQLHVGHTLACCAITTASTRAVARRLGHLKADWGRKGQSLALPDVLITAVALEHGLALATGNRKHFPMPELNLLPVA